MSKKGDRINKISQDINSIIAEYVVMDKEDDYKNLFYELYTEIEDTVQSASIVYGDYIQHGLNFNTIESEGFLRCAKTLFSHAEELKNSYLDSEDND